MPNGIITTVAALPCMVIVLLAVSSCGGGGDQSTAPALPPVPPLALTLPTARISADTLVTTGCTGGATAGQFFVNAEVEPFAAAQPGNPKLLLSTWQQDRWSNGGARAVVTAVSPDGGGNWTRQLMPFSRCGSASPGSTGDFERASDPWVDIGPTGTLHAMALGFNIGALLPGSASAMLASRSTDGGLSWSQPTTLARDGETLFHDKNSLTADPTDARYVYAVWDRLDASNFGPTLLARSVNGGATWEAARVIYAPAVAAGASGVSQTIGNRIVVMPDGTLVNLFTQIDTVGNTASTWLGVLRSTDKGLTWSAPIRVAELQAVGARDPQTGKRIRDGATLGTIAVAPNGGLWLAWQDARFSNGLRDAIALSRSTDGGLSWTAPVAINSTPGVAAFTPSATVSSDGLVGISHYDLRDDTPDANTLLAGAWLLSSRDGVTWIETKIWSPFDLAQAPDAGGLFLGDYQGLLSVGSAFMPVLALSGHNIGNRTDIYALQVTPASRAQAAPKAKVVARVMATTPTAGLSDEAFRQARHTAIVHAMEQRLPGWAERGRLTPRRAERP